MRLPFALLFVLGWLGSAECAEVLSGQTPQHAVASDFDLDGLQDLAVANTFDDSVTIHLQDLSGGFPISQTLTVGINPGVPNDLPRFLRVWDINRDGYPDLLVLCSGSFPFGFEPSVQSLINLGDGSFARLEADPTTSVFVAEEFPIQFDAGNLTSDHYLDLAVANLDGRTIRVMIGDGTGRFDLGPSIAVDTGGEGPQDLAVKDLNGDGHDDILAVTANSLLAIQQISEGVFGPPQSYPLPAPTSNLRALVLDDLVVDGALDVALADADGRIQILFGPDIGGASLGFEVRNDPSLSGCSDIATIFWDGDGAPDLAVTNRTGDSVTVFGSTGSILSYPTGAQPRRLETGADLNGDGRNDIMTANEGDQTVSGNPDVNILTNDATPIGGPYIPMLNEEGTFENLFELNLFHPVGLSALEEDNRLWVLESSRRSLQETDMDANKRDRIEVGFEIGGVHFREIEEGYLLARFESRIYEFEIDDSDELEIEGSESFAYDPGELGFCGLAYDEENKEFYVSVPAKEKVLRLDEDAGLLSEIDISPAAWDLAWDEDAKRLLVANPGRSDIRAYSSDGTLDPARSFDMADRTALFVDVGVAGVACPEEDNRLYLLATSGLLLRTNLSGAISETNTLSPLVDVSAAAFDTGRNEVYLLSPDAHVKRIAFPSPTGAVAISVISALSADTTFVPSGVAFDSATDRFVVGDRNQARVARFTRSGAFEGFVDLSVSVDLEGERVHGIDYDPDTSSYLFRTEFSVKSAAMSIPLPSARTSSLDIALGQGFLCSGLPNPQELIFASFPPTSEEFVADLQGVSCPGSIAFDGFGRFVHFTNTQECVWKAYVLTAFSDVENWNVYE